MQNSRLISLGMVLTGLLWIFTLGQTAVGKIVERVIAQVNEDVITLTEYKVELANLRMIIEKELPAGKDREEAFEKKKSEVLDGLVRDKLLWQRAREYGLCSNVETEVTAYVDRLKKQYNLTAEQFEQELTKESLTLLAFRENIARRICIDRLIGQFVTNKLTITTEEIEKYYNEHKGQFTKPEEVDLNEIVFYLEGREAAEVEAKAKAALEQLKKGAEFSEIAKKYSEGPTKDSGGAIGTFKPGMMAPEVEKAAFALNAGETSPELIRTKFGFQILKVTRKQKSELTALADVRTRIQDFLMMQKMQPELDRFYKKLKEESYIHIYPENP
ncbi:MAG: peptidylprolyl isomerase [Acidobacteria bacterium]|nr:peptidylprolyl isomerase [Acidobacteriota bacterium]MBI3655240.1 peptidylprolyl isomerase [Acidobacteriota bacterium]